MYSARRGKDFPLCPTVRVIIRSLWLQERANSNLAVEAEPWWIEVRETWTTDTLVSPAKAFLTISRWASLTLGSQGFLVSFLTCHSSLQFGQILCSFYVTLWMCTLIPIGLTVPIWSVASMGNTTQKKNHYTMPSFQFRQTKPTSVIFPNITAFLKFFLTPAVHQIKHVFVPEETKGWVYTGLAMLLIGNYHY